MGLSLESCAQAVVPGARWPRPPSAGLEILPQVMPCSFVTRSSLFFAPDSVGQRSGQVSAGLLLSAWPGECSCAIRQLRGAVCSGRTWLLLCPFGAPHVQRATWWWKSSLGQEGTPRRPPEAEAWGPRGPLCFLLLVTPWHSPAQIQGMRTETASPDGELRRVCAILYLRLQTLEALKLGPFIGLFVGHTLISFLISILMVVKYT